MTSLSSAPQTEAQTFFAEDRHFPLARLLIGCVALANVASAVVMLIGQA